MQFYPFYNTFEVKFLLHDAQTDEHFDTIEYNLPRLSSHLIFKESILTCGYMTLILFTVILDDLFFENIDTVAFGCNFFHHETVEMVALPMNFNFLFLAFLIFYLHYLGFF